MDNKMGAGRVKELSNHVEGRVIELIEGIQNSSNRMGEVFRRGLQCNHK